jgi:hypothetical protein
MGGKVSVEISPYGRSSGGMVAETSGIYLARLVPSPNMDTQNIMD